MARLLGVLLCVFALSAIFWSHTKEANDNYDPPTEDVNDGNDSWVEVPEPIPHVSVSERRISSEIPDVKPSDISSHDWPTAITLHQPAEFLFRENSNVTLKKQAPLLVGGRVLRIGKAGETFVVNNYDPEATRVSCRSTEPNVGERDIEITRRYLTGGDPLLVSSGTVVKVVRVTDDRLVVAFDGRSAIVDPRVTDWSRQVAKQRDVNQRNDNQQRRIENLAQTKKSQEITPDFNKFNGDAQEFIRKNSPPSGSPPPSKSHDGGFFANWRKNSKKNQQDYDAGFSKGLREGGLYALYRAGEAPSVLSFSGIIDNAAKDAGMESSKKWRDGFEMGFKFAFSEFRRRMKPAF